MIDKILIEQKNNVKKIACLNNGNLVEFFVRCTAKSRIFTNFVQKNPFFPLKEWFFCTFVYE